MNFYQDCRRINNLFLTLWLSNRSSLQTLSIHTRIINKGWTIFKFFYLVLRFLVKNWGFLVEGFSFCFGIIYSCVTLFAVDLCIYLYHFVARIDKSIGGFIAILSRFSGVIGDCLRLYMFVFDFYSCKLFFYKNRLICLRFDLSPVFSRARRVLWLFGRHRCSYVLIQSLLVCLGYAGMFSKQLGWDTSRFQLVLAEYQATGVRQNRRKTGFVPESSRCSYPSRPVLGDPFPRPFDPILIFKSPNQNF